MGALAPGRRGEPCQALRAATWTAESEARRREPWTPAGDGSAAVTISVGQERHHFAGDELARRHDRQMALAGQDGDALTKRLTLDLVWDSKADWTFEEVSLRRSTKPPAGCADSPSLSATSCVVPIPDRERSREIGVCDPSTRVSLPPCFGSLPIAQAREVRGRLRR